MGRLKIRSGWVEYFRKNYELRWPVTIKAGLLIEAFDKIRAGVRADRSQFFKTLTMAFMAVTGDPATLPDALKERDLTPRQRKPLNAFVYTGHWGKSSPVRGES
jgi:hypothetical protein